MARPQNRSHAIVQPVDFLRAQARAAPHRIDRRAPQNFVRVRIADPRHELLVRQHPFDFTLELAQPLAKGLKCQFRIVRLGTHPDESGHLAQTRR